MRVLNLLLLLLPLLTVAQKKKELKKYGIKTIVATETHGGKTITDSRSVYNSAGLLIEETNYNKDGLLKSVTRYKYNSDGDVLEETEFDDKNNVKEKRTYKYNGLGEKTEELVNTADGKQLKRTVYTYDSRGFKTGKDTYDAANNLVSSKRITYSTK